MKRLCVIFLLALVGAEPPPLRAQTFFSQDEQIIPPEIDHMYVKGIQYLAQKQNSAGSWDAPFGTEPAVVGLAMLSILAHGEDPNYGPYKDTVHKALDFILKNQDPNSGYIGTSMYNHGFSTLALAEAYGYVHDDRIGPALQKAVDLILSSQSRNPNHAWRYSPDNPDADTTVSGAQMVALFAARNAGIGVPEDAIRKALRFFAECQTPGRRHRLHRPGRSRRGADGHRRSCFLAGAGSRNRPPFAPQSITSTPTHGRRRLSPILSLLRRPGIIPRLAPGV